MLSTVTNNLGRLSLTSHPSRLNINSITSLTNILTRNFATKGSSAAKRKAKKLAQKEQSKKEEKLSQKVAVVRDVNYTHRWKNPFKRASGLMTVLSKEIEAEMKNGRDFSFIKPGDAIEVLRYVDGDKTKAVPVRGTLIAKHNRQHDSTIKILNVELGVPILRNIKLYNPNVIDVKVLREAHLHKGAKRKKRVRRAKLYYLLKPEHAKLMRKLAIKYDTNFDNQK